MALRYGGPAALAARCPPVATGHVGGGRGLVEEHQTVQVEGIVVREPVLPGGLQVGPLLIGRVLCPLLQVMPCRAKKRDRPLVLVSTPRSAKAARSSCR